MTDHSVRESSDDVRIYMVDCVGVIQRECADKRMKQHDVALSYAAAIKTDEAKVEAVDWKAINEAIVARWPKGLNRVKERAWGIVTGRIKP
jgi:hypothetical protein